MQEKGIFITFMAFLLVSTVLALSISVNQAVIGQEQNLAEETAFSSVDNRFNSIRQQIVVVKEGYAGETYSRFMPFEKFSAGENWFEVEQKLPIETSYIENTKNILKLFSIFVEEEGNEGGVFVDVTIPDFDDPDFDNKRIKYIVKPQCAEFYVDDDTNSFEIKSNTTAEGCEDSGFSINDVEKYEIELNVSNLDEAGVICTGEFGNGECKNESLVTDPAIEIKIIEIKIIHPVGVETISANLITGNGIATVNINGSENVTIVLTSDSTSDSLSINLNNWTNSQNAFKAKVFFKDQIDEIVLTQDLFGFSVKNEGFDLCRGTEAKACD